MNYSMKMFDSKGKLMCEFEANRGLVNLNAKTGYEKVVFIEAELRVYFQSGGGYDK